MRRVLASTVGMRESGIGPALQPKSSITTIVVIMITITTTIIIVVRVIIISESMIRYMACDRSQDVDISISCSIHIMNMSAGVLGHVELWRWPCPAPGVKNILTSGTGHGYIAASMQR